MEKDNLKERTVAENLGFSVEGTKVEVVANKVIINDGDDNFEKTLKEVVHNLRGVFKDFMDCS